PRPPHDPTHPSTPESSQRGSARPEIGPAQSGPSSAGTKQIPIKASQPSEPPTTRLSTPGKPGAPGRGSSSPAPAAPSSARPPAPTPPPAPSAGQTRAMPIPGSRSVETDSADATAKLPVQRPEDSDSDAATEQLNARGAQGDNGARRRRGAGGLSAQDLLRREGRL
ncbi:hypothetical protein C3473_21450, partial [Mycobacterium kansasii]